jgi:regulator of protease activity HflC (stomatin/prohibitin superfamily)
MQYGNITTFDTLLAWVALLASIVVAIYTVLVFWVIWRRSGLHLALIRLLSYRILLPWLLVVGLHTLSAALVFVLPQQVAVVVSILAPGGIRVEPLRPGLHWIVPFLERKIAYPIAWQTYTMSNHLDEGSRLGDDSIRARTKDGQEVRIDCSIIFAIKPEQAAAVHRDWQNRYIEDLMRPLIRALVRTQVSQYQVFEVNSEKRKDLEETLDRLLRERFAEKGFILDSFLLRDITFTVEYAAAIEHKQVALEGIEQKKHEADQIRTLSKGQADAVEIAAQAQAQAIKLVAEALQRDSSVLMYYYIDKLSPNVRVMLVPNNAPLLLPLPSLDGQDGTKPPSSSLEPASTTTLPPPSEARRLGAALMEPSMVRPDSGPSSP